MNSSLSLSPAATSHPPCLSFLRRCASSRSTLPTDRVARISDSFDFPNPRGEFNGAMERTRARARARERKRERDGVPLRLKLFSELDVRSRAEARQLLIVLLAGACVECLTTVEDGFEFPKLVRRILGARPILHRLVLVRITTQSIKSAELCDLYRCPRTRHARRCPDSFHSTSGMKICHVRIRALIVSRNYYLKSA